MSAAMSTNAYTNSSKAPQKCTEKLVRNRWSAADTPLKAIAGKPSPLADQHDVRSSPSPPTNNAMYHPSRYKIELCYQYGETGKCEFGERCLYAHGLYELRPCTYRHKKFRTQLCRAFHENGFCSFGSRCSFIHTKPDLDGLMSRINGSPKLLPMPENPSAGQPLVELAAIGKPRRVSIHEEEEFDLLPSPFVAADGSRLPSFVKICNRQSTVNGFRF